MKTPKFTNFATERDVAKSLDKARIHAVADRVIWATHDCTAQDAVKGTAKGRSPHFRVFPCADHKSAVALAKVLA